MKTKDVIMHTKADLDFLFLNEVRRMLTDLSKSQFSVYKAVISFVKENKVSPTLQDIADITKLSKQGVSDKLKELAIKNYIAFAKGKVRNIVLLHENFDLKLKAAESIEKELIKYREMVDKNLITLEDYEAKKKKVLGID